MTAALDVVPPEPGSPEWLRLMTASKVAAVLGVSPWESPRSLWHRMRGELPSDDGNNVAAKARGHYLEAGCLAWWEDQHPEVLDTTLLEQHYATRADMPWAAATLDALAHDVHGNTIVVEVKTSQSNDDWGTPGTDEIPAYYAAQIMWSFAMVPEAQLAYVAVLFGYPRLGFEEYVIQRDDDLIAAITQRCRAFYDSLASDEPPDLDDSVATYEAIRAIHPLINEGEKVELTPEQAFEFLDAGDCAKAAVVRERAAKTVVLDVMGNAQFGYSNGLKVARRQPSNGTVALYTATKIRPIQDTEQGATP
jgi:putative phage-type endonuclease